jgi:hypothetical protein
MSEPTNDEPPSSSSISIQLGYIIQINAPSNSEINNRVFFVDYIDARKIKLINVETLATHTIKIDASGKITDESITNIAILSRPEKEGYARQNGLVMNTWIDVHFGGDLPTTITGLITNVEEDMIEIKTFPDDDIIYIDFGYKGIPEDLPIDRIHIRSPPSSIQKDETEPSSEIKDNEDLERENVRVIRAESGADASEQPQGASETTSAINLDIGIPPPFAAEAPPSSMLKQKIQDLLFDADQIHFGAELDVLVQFIEVPDSQKRYSIEKQVTDLYDDMISNVPNPKRTHSVLSNIHTMVERFKHLRQIYSTFDQNGNPAIPSPKGLLHKPLLSVLLNMNRAIGWILPVVKNRRILHDVDYDVYPDETDVVFRTTQNEVNAVHTLQKAFKTNNETYERTIKRLSSEVFTPFQEPDNTAIHEALLHRAVGDNITAVVDNLENFYSTVISNSNKRQRRFVIQRYNLGLNKLQPRILKSSVMSADFAPLTPADSLTMHSVIVLPVQAVRLSRINLPSTNVLDRANINAHNLNYWEMLRSTTSITTEEITDLNVPIEFNSHNFLNTIKEYVLDPTVENSPDRYRRFLDVIIPKTRVLFEIMRKYIHSRLSLTEVLALLEPFAIYQQDITSKQYDEIVAFLHDRLAEYKRNLVTQSRRFNKIRAYKYSIQYAGVSFLYKLLVTGKMLDANVFSAYGFTDAQVRSATTSSGSEGITAKERQQARGRAYTTGVGDQDEYNDHLLSSSELLSRMLTVDYARLYMDAISLTTTDLITPFDFNLIMKEGEEELKGGNAEEEGSNAPKKGGLVLAKHYINIDALNEDNDADVEIFFDKKYDTTDYDFLKKYEDEREAMDEADFKMFIIDQIIKEKRVGMDVAEKDAEAMLTGPGMRPVRDGDYAVVEVDDYDEAGEVTISFLYYKMENGKWVRDDSIPVTTPTDDASYFCYIQKDCLPMMKSGRIMEECLPKMKSGRIMEEMSADGAVNSMKKKLIDAMVSEFDMKYQVTRENFMNFLNKKFDYDLKAANKLVELANLQLFKYNDRKYYLGLSGSTSNTPGADEGYEITVSPHASLRNMILAQTDYVKRQSDILRFISSFTRKANPILEEDSAWLYCIQTGEKLLPSFFETIAIAFMQVNQGSSTWVDFGIVVDTICKERGTDDGEFCVDKYSGYVIKRIEHSTDEGHDEEGFKIITKQVLEADAGETVLKVASNIPAAKPRVYNSPSARMIHNIVTTMAGYIGVDLKDATEFIIQNAVNNLETSFLSEEDYKVRSEKNFQAKGKHLDPYKDYYFQALLLLSLGYTLVAVQTAIPSLKTRKTHPGCVRSFTGFPLDGAEDTTGIQYIACIAMKIQSSIEPWNTLKKFKKEALLAEKLKLIVESILCPNGAVQERLQAKRDYVKTAEKEESIPSSITVMRWSNFMPQLGDISNMKTPQNVSSDFNNHLLDDMKRGHRGQHERIGVIQSKMMYFTLDMQRMINEVVKHNSPLLANYATNEPFLENACCNETDTRHVKTLDYFMKANQSIHHNNKIIEYLRTILSDMENLRRCAFLSDYRNTKYQYPAIPQTFDEKTIYQAFITYCHFNSDLPISDDIKLLCMEKPSDWNATENIDDKIRKLKRDSRIFTVESLDNLLQIVNSDRIIHTSHIVEGNRKENLQLHRLRDVLSYFDGKEEEKCIIPEELRALMRANMDTFEISTQEDTEEMRAMKNYLATSNQQLTNKLLTFMRENSKQSRGTIQDMEKLFMTLMLFEVNGDNILMSDVDETTSKAIQFMRNSLYKLIDVLPNIILNSVDYDNLDTPKHWDVSQRHGEDIKNIISGYYTSLKPFYKDDVVREVIKHATERVKDLKKMVDVTPFFAEMFFEPAIGIGGRPRKNITPTYALFDRRIVTLLHEFYFLTLFVEYVNLVLDTPVSIFQSEPTELVRPGSKSAKTFKGTAAVTSMTQPSTLRDRAYGSQEDVLREQEDEGASVLTSRDEVRDRVTGVTEMSIILGNRKALGQKVADLLVMYARVIESDKQAINYNQKTIREKITRIKDKEKDGVVQEFAVLSMPQRALEKLKKIHKIDRWSKGLKRSVFEYDPDNYDEERDAMIALANAEKRSGKRDGVTAMNQEIYMLDMLEEEMIDQQIIAHEYDMSHLPSDDNYPDDSDTGYMMRYPGDGERDDDSEWM